MRIGSGGTRQRACPSAQKRRLTIAESDASCWAVASARRDRDIVSSARLILVISKRVSDLSADPPDACSRAAGQLARRDARLLQSPRSGTVAGGHALAAGIAQTQQSQRECWLSINGAVSDRAQRLLVFVQSGSRGSATGLCRSSPHEQPTYCIQVAMAVPPVLSDFFRTPNAPNRNGRGGRTATQSSTRSRTTSAPASSRFLRPASVSTSDYAPSIGPIGGRGKFGLNGRSKRAKSLGAKYTSVRAGVSSSFGSPTL
jgi:hypothetical protein